jgi:hypothetical protein
MIGLRLCQPQGCYLPEMDFSCRWHVERISLDQIATLEASVLWYTEGKGETDLGVAAFQRLDGEHVMRMAGRGRLQTQLPASPLSYEGRLLSVRWCVRLRLFLVDGRDIAAQQAFYVGALTRDV